MGNSKKQEMIFKHDLAISISEQGAQNSRKHSTTVYSDIFRTRKLARARKREREREQERDSGQPVDSAACHSRGWLLRISIGPG